MRGFPVGFEAAVCHKAAAFVKRVRPRFSLGAGFIWCGCQIRDGRSCQTGDGWFSIKGPPAFLLCAPENFAFIFPGLLNLSSLKYLFTELARVFYQKATH